MESRDSFKIVILGAGNVATHISRHLVSAGHRIDCIWSPGKRSAQVLAEELGATACWKLSALPKDADFYILAIPDRFVEELALELKGSIGIFLHTAGALPMKVLEATAAGRPSGPGHGVLYPLQTLSREHKLEVEDVPMLVEASDPETQELILSLARSVWPYVETAHGDERLKLHLAAVFANNFTNYMISIGMDLLEEEDLNPELLRPLIKETFRKAKALGPRDAQTGPALRGDTGTMEKHLELLKGREGLEKIYTFVSREIEKSREK